jgi:hypothetical protein
MLPRSGEAGLHTGYRYRGEALPVGNRFEVDPDADGSVVEHFATVLEEHGGAKLGRGYAGSSGQLPFHLDVEAETDRRAIEEAIDLIDAALNRVDPTGDLEGWLRYAGRWSTEELHIGSTGRHEL